MWLKVVVFFKKCWELIKKTPGWVLFGILLLLAVVWHLIGRQARLKKRLAVQKEITNIEVDRAAVRASAEAVSEAEEAAAQEEHDRTMAELKRKEKEIQDAASRGPVAIANEWKEFLTNRGSDE